MSGFEMDVIAPVERFLAVGGYVGSKVALIGRLVGREACVAVEAIGDVLDAEMRHRGVEFCNLQDGLFDVGFEVFSHGIVFFLVLIKPLAVVVAGYFR